MKIAMRSKSSKSQKTTAPFLLYRQLFALLVLCSSLFAACSPGHDGSKVIGFVRDGSLWTIDPNGANPFEVVSGNHYVLDFAWSPTHQLLAYRTFDPERAKTTEQIPRRPLIGVVSDIPSAIHTIGVDGGSSIPIAYSSASLRYSLPIWNTNDSRLLYRSGNLQTPDLPVWSIAQNDQPGGIALKTLPLSFSIPSFSYQQDAYRVLANDQDGIFTTTLAGDQVKALTDHGIPGHPLPAGLERVLWRPAHQDREFLYAEIVPTVAPQEPDKLVVQLTLQTIDGKTTSLATCMCRQFAWSPDGRFVLYSTPEGYTVLDLTTNASWEIPDQATGVPYWSPDSRFLLLDGEQGMWLVDPTSKHQQKLLSAQQSTPPSPTEQEQIFTAGELLQPAANSPWSADSRHLLFLTRDRLQWQETALQQGLHTVEIDEKGRPQQPPTRIAEGNITQAGWTYQDANTSFLH